MRYIFLLSAFVLIVRGTSVLLFKYKAVTLIIGHISLVLGKIHLNFILLIIQKLVNVFSQSVPEVSWSPPVLPASLFWGCSAWLDPHTVLQIL